jgi:hypothetical protein
MRLETCKRGVHVNRIVNRVSRNLRGDKHLEEWHVFLFGKREVKHRTVKVIGQEDTLWRSSR